MPGFYVDTGIWRDYLENRADCVRPLGEFAYRFFKNVKDERHMILYARITEVELLSKFSVNEVEAFLFGDLKKAGLLRFVDTNSKQTSEAERLAFTRHLPKGDCLIAVLARDNQAIVITRDAHFKELADIVESKKPEDVI